MSQKKENLKLGWSDHKFFIFDLNIIFKIKGI